MKIKKDELLEFQRMGVEMYKQGYLDAYSRLKKSKDKIKLWLEIKKYCWKDFQDRFINVKQLKGGKKSK